MSQFQDSRIPSIKKNVFVFQFFIMYSYSEVQKLKALGDIDISQFYIHHTLKGVFLVKIDVILLIFSTFLSILLKEIGKFFITT